MKFTKYLPAVFLLIVFLGISISSSFYESLTYDEIVHIQEGKNALLNHTFTIDTNNPPFEREFAALPLVFHLDYLLHSHIPNIQVFPARLMIILLSICLGIGIFFVSYQYLGLWSAYLSLVLYIFDPNILGNNHYVTFDVGFTLFFFLAYVFLVKTIENVTVKRIIILSICIGLGLASKISFIPYYLLSFCIVLVVLKKKSVGKFIWEKKWIFFLVCFIALITLWGTYFFTSDVIIAKRADANRVSARLTLYAKSHHNSLLLTLLNLGEHQQVPLGNYFAMIKNNSIRNAQANTYVFWGKSFTSHHWYFMIVNMLAKTPIALLSLFFIGLVGLRKRKMLAIFLIPIIVIIVITSSTNLSPWVRYILPIYPFMTIIAGGTLSLNNRLLTKYFMFVLLVWYIFSTVQFYPHFLFYTNELVAGVPKKELLFIDSNIDWGQSIPDLVAFIQKENPRNILLSYFGRDRADQYGLQSKMPYGSYKFSDICAFHIIPWNRKGKDMTVISISNWYYCGYAQKKEYNTNTIKAIVGHSMLVF